MQNEKDQGMEKLCFITIGLLVRDAPTVQARGWPLVESSQHIKHYAQHPALETVTNLSQFKPLLFLISRHFFAISYGDHDHRPLGSSSYSLHVWICWHGTNAPQPEGGTIQTILLYLITRCQCDESKPSCQKCISHKLSCSYLQYIPAGSRGSRQCQKIAKHPHNSLQRQDTQNELSQTRSQSDRTIEMNSPKLQSNRIGTIFNTQDLHLLHFYTTQTSVSMLGPHMTGSNIWGTSIVTLSFSQTYLLYALLSLSALHLSFLHSSDNGVPHQKSLATEYQYLATLYHTKCITLFRHEIQILSASNAAACAACASYLSLFAWAKPGARGADLFFPSDTAESSAQLLDKTSPDSSSTSDIIHVKAVPWYKIQRGGHLIVSKTYAWVSASEYHDIVDPWQTINCDHIYRHPHPMYQSVINSRDSDNLDLVATCWTDTSSAINDDFADVLSGEDIDALDETLQTLHYVFKLLAILQSPQKNLVSSTSSVALPPTQISASIAVLSWTTLLPSRFCDMVESRVPQALVLIAVYCVALKRAEDLWWIRGKAESLLGAVRRELSSDERWERWLEWPMAEVHRLE